MTQKKIKYNKVWTIIIANNILDADFMTAYLSFKKDLLHL
jgi:hypothetical protein